MPTLTILRAVSGAGKTSFAKYIQSVNPDTIICEADDYFMVNGQYAFDGSKLHLAHKFCQEKFKAALAFGVDIVVSNTSVRRQDREFYRKTALECGYKVYSLIVEKLGTADVHSLPKEVLDRQRQTLKNNIDL